MNFSISVADSCGKKERPEAKDFGRREIGCSIVLVQIAEINWT